MNDIVNVWVLVKQRIKCCFVCDVELYKLRALAADQLYPIDDLFGGIVEVVGNDNFVASFEERKGCERADVASASVHTISVRGRWCSADVPTQ